MRFDEFERYAREQWDRIPDRYMEGIDGLVVERAARAHPSLPDVYTLGECLTESWPSDFEGPESVRSVVVLYYGSFQRLSRLDESFDWEAEIWETLTHELQHHLESLARDEGLLDLDYAMDESFKRREGEPFDPTYYRGGENRGGGWFAVEHELYHEVELDAVPEAIQFELDGATYRVPVSDRDADTLFLDVVDGLPANAPPVTIVVHRRRGLRDVVRAVLGRAARRIAQHEVDAESA